VDTLSVIDLNSIMHIYYNNRHLPDFSWTVDGEVIRTKAMFGAFKLLTLDGKKVFCGDRRSTKRKNINPDYKSNRSVAPKDFYEQFKRVEEALIESGINYFAEEGYECDDLIASIVNKYKNSYNINIYSNDRDFAVLVGPSVQYKSLVSRFPDITMYNYEDVLCNSYKVYIPYNTLTLYKAIVGDVSDNIKGILGLGKGYFEKLIDRMKQDKVIFSEVYGNEESIIKKYLPEELQEEALNSLRLARFFHVDLEIKDTENKNKLIECLNKYGMKSIISKLQ